MPRRPAPALLAVSPAWLSLPGTLQVRCGHLRRRHVGNAAPLDPVAGSRVARSVAEVIAACTLDRLRTTENAPHFWQGSPDLGGRSSPPKLARP